MFPQTLRWLEILAVLATLASIGYYCLCLWGAAAYLRERNRQRDIDARSNPPVSILKPLKGTDPEMYESFRSHCLQDYGNYEIIFGVSDSADSAVRLVEQIKAEFPQRDIRLLVCSERLGTNTKVSNLAQMVRLAKYAYLIVNDSDIRVGTDYLRSVVPPLASGIGMVTCLYRGVAGGTLGSSLEGVGINTDFIAGVLAARTLEGIRFGLGSTLAFSRSDLDAIGGFEALVDYLADDYELGNRIAGLGKRIELSSAVVETFLPAYSFMDFMRHQVRWARTIRDSRKGGYIGLGLTFGIPWALATVLLSAGAPWAWMMLALTAVMRLLVAETVASKVLRDHQFWNSLCLVPVRDFLALLVWIISFGGHTISWRGDRFVLRNGKLDKIPY